MIPINLLIDYPVINMQKVHPLIDQIVHGTSALRGTTVVSRYCSQLIRTSHFRFLTLKIRLFSPILFQTFLL